MLKRFLEECWYRFTISWERYWDWPHCRRCGEYLDETELRRSMTHCFDCEATGAESDDPGNYAYPLTTTPTKPFKRAA